jgi:hypothetical protein
MGNRCSGRWFHPNAKSTIESELRIGIKALKEAGCLTPGAAGSLSWSRDNRISQIDFQTLKDRILFKYQYEKPGSNCQDVERTIRLERQPCHFGGHRIWFRCPGCNRRTSALYFIGHQFWCRICHDLSYASQNANELDLLISKINRTYEKLGAGSVNVFGNIPKRPRGMHKSTYDRLYKVAEETRFQLADAIIKRFGVLN